MPDTRLTAHARLLLPLLSLMSPAAAQGFGGPQTISTSQDFPTSAHPVDLDGDGDLDIVSASANDATIAWYANLGGGAFSSPLTIDASASGARWVTSADLDADGDADLVAAIEFLPSE